MWELAIPENTNIPLLNRRRFRLVVTLIGNRQEKGVSLQAKHRISEVARTGFLALRVDPALRRDIQLMADEEQRTTVEGMTLLTIDSLVAKYPGPIRMV